jgi:hypothetical protein
MRRHYLNPASSMLIEYGPDEAEADLGRARGE